MFKGVSLEEFHQRVRSIRDRMKARDLQALLIYSQKRGHVTYLSGYRPNYHTNSAVVALPLDRDPAMWIKFPFDLARAQAMSWFDDIRPSISEDAGKMLSGPAERIRSLGLDRSRVGLVASDLAVDEMGISLYEALRAELPNARLEPASDLLNDLRLIKSQSEIGALRAAAQLADRVAQSLVSELRPGNNEQHAVAVATQTARLEHGQCDVFISSDPSRLAYPPSSREFQQGAVVNCEFTVQLDGYWVQLCRVYSIGEPANAQKQIFQACQNAYEAAIGVARPGTPVADLAEAAYRAIAEAGYQKYIQYGVGHGVGLDLPELYLVEPGCRNRLLPGMVLVIHPSIFVPGQGAAFVGGPIAVSEDGPVRLHLPQAGIIEV